MTDCSICLVAIIPENEVTVSDPSLQLTHKDNLKCKDTSSHENSLPLPSPSTSHSGSSRLSKEEEEEEGEDPIRLGEEHIQAGKKRNEDDINNRDGCLSSIFCFPSFYKPTLNSGGDGVDDGQDENGKNDEEDRGEVMSRTYNLYEKIYPDSLKCKHKDKEKKKSITIENESLVTREKYIGDYLESLYPLEKGCKTIVISSHPHLQGKEDDPKRIELYLTPCKHYFHKECLKAWFKAKGLESKACPN